MIKIVYALTTCSNCKNNVIVELGKYSGFDSVMNDINNVNCISCSFIFKLDLFKSDVISIEPKEHYNQLKTLYPDLKNKMIHNNIVEIIKKKLK